MVRSRGPLQQARHSTAPYLRLPLPRPVHSAPRRTLALTTWTPSVPRPRGIHQVRLGYARLRRQAAPASPSRPAAAARQSSLPALDTVRRRLRTPAPALPSGAAGTEHSAARHDLREVCVVEMRRDIHVSTHGRTASANRPG